MSVGGPEHAHVRCPACGLYIRLTRANGPGRFDSYDVEAAFTAVDLHLTHGCRVAAGAEDRAGREASP